jgi:hypothetical protein
MISCRAIARNDQNQITPTPVVEYNEKNENKLSNPQIIVFTESDVQSWILNFSTQNPDLNLSNPEVNLDNGFCLISADFEPVNNANGNSMLNTFSGRIDMEFTINVNSNNIPIVDVQNLKIEGVELPQFLLNQISGKINQSISSSLSAQIGGYTISDIIISNGKIIVTMLI